MTHPINAQSEPPERNDRPLPIRMAALLNHQIVRFLPQLVVGGVLRPFLILL